MRLCSFRGPDGPVPGLVDADTVIPLAAASTLDIIRGAPADVASRPMPPPAEPVLFAKMRGTVNRPSGPVVHPQWTRRLDYEGELGVVIGRPAHRVASADALEHVFGYLVCNDVSARDRQKAEPQWILAPGDVVRIEISGLGAIEHEIVAG